ncbi:MAG TPA: hypothetical protein VGL02_30145 [Streptomyces sp.]
MADTSEIAKQLADIQDRLGTGTAAKYAVAELTKEYGATAVNEAVRHNETRHIYR